LWLTALTSGCSTSAIDHYEVVADLSRCKDVPAERAQMDEQLDACCSACSRTVLEVNKRAQQYWDGVVLYRTVGALAGVVVIAVGLLALSRALAGRSRSRFWMSAVLTGGALAMACSGVTEGALAASRLDKLRGASSLTRQMRAYHMHEASHPDTGITCIRALDWARGRGTGPACSVEIGKFDGFDEDLHGSLDIHRGAAADQQVTEKLDHRIGLLEDLIRLGKYGMDPEAAARTPADRESELDVYRANPYFADAAPIPRGLLGPAAHAAVSELGGMLLFLVLFRLQMRRKFRTAGAR